MRIKLAKALKIWKMLKNEDYKENISTLKITYYLKVIKISKERKQKMNVIVFKKGNNNNNN